MLSRRIALGAALALCLLPGPLAADTSEKFTWAAFEAAQQAGKPILVEVYAAWCPICRVQRPIIEDLVMSDRFKDVVYFELSFDRQKDELRKLNAQKQATLLMFKGAKETGRSIGDTDRASIEAMMAKAL